MVLLKKTELPPLAVGLLQLLMDQSCGCLPLVELCSMYETTFGTECDIQAIKEELVDFVEVFTNFVSILLRHYFLNEYFGKSIYIRNLMLCLI